MPVVGPEQARGDGPPRAPGEAHLPQDPLAGPGLEPEELPGRVLEGEVARREDVGPSEREHRIDLRRPHADALDAGQRGDDLGVGQVAQRDEVEAGAGEGAAVGDLLTREACGAQRLVARGAEGGRIGGAEGRDATPDSGRRRGRDLLADDRRQQRLESVAAPAERQRTGQLQRPRKARIEGGEPARPLRDVVVGLDDARRPILPRPPDLETPRCSRTGRARIAAAVGMARL